MANVHKNENEVEYVTEIVKGGIKFNLNRFILESLVIEDARSDDQIKVMNSRSQCGGQGLTRITITQ